MALSHWVAQASANRHDGARAVSSYHAALSSPLAMAGGGAVLLWSGAGAKARGNGRGGDRSLARVSAPGASARRCLGRSHPALLQAGARDRGQGPHRRLLAGDGSRPGGRGRDPRADQRGLPGPRHPWRGARARAARCPLHLGHRSHRRHQGVHLRHDDLGHADRAAGPWPGHRRRAGPAFPARALRRPRRRRLSGQSAPCRAIVPRAERGDPLRDRARHVHAGRAPGSTRWPHRCVSAASAPIAMPTGCLPPASSIWWSKRA